MTSGALKVFLFVLVSFVSDSLFENLAPPKPPMKFLTVAKKGIRLCPEGGGDKEDSCVYWEKLQYCNKGHAYYEFMKNTCPASCGICQARPTPAPKVDKNDCLAAHNARRARHGARPLTWDDTLAHHAQQWADHLLRIGRMVHARGTGEGENLAHGWGVKVLTCEEAMTGWYDKEEPMYNYKKPRFSKATGHFTQVVWKGTTKVGVALAHKRRSDGMIESFIVARYFPPGNIRGYFTKNVGESGDKGRSRLMDFIELQKDWQEL